MKGISKRNKWTYSIGCVGRDMVFVLVSMFMLVYIQYTINLTVTQFSVVSGIMVFSRVLDVINDPVIAMLIENARFKSGKFKPWVMIGGGTNFAITMLLFTFRPSGWAFVVFFGIAYIAWGITFTINDIAYWSMIPALTKDSQERNSLTNLVMVFASIGQFTASGLIPILVTGNAVLMYRVIGIVVSLLFLAFTALTYFGVEEKSNHDQKQEKVDFKKMYKILRNNDQLIVVGVATLLYTVASGLFLALGMNFFYFEFGYGGTELTGFMLVFAIGTLSALAAFPILTKYFQRMKIMGIATASAVIGYIVFMALGYLIPMNLGLLYGSAFLVFFGHNLFFVVLMVMVSNVVEYNEVNTGERNESIVLGIRPFMSKIGGAIQQGILTLILILSGVFVYSQKIAELEIKMDQGIIGDITAQANAVISSATPMMLLMLRVGMGLIPMLSILGAYILMKKKYIISEDKYDEIIKELGR